jgi:hypothetical protein
MASIASQLQAIKSALGAAPEPPRRPVTRPSVLFDAKEAADIDLRAILPIALSGRVSITNHPCDRFEIALFALPDNPSVLESGFSLGSYLSSSIYSSQFSPGFSLEFSF